jgi:hypothetical protein
LRDDAELGHAAGARRDDRPAKVRRTGIEREDVAGADHAVPCRVVLTALWLPRSAARVTVPGCCRHLSLP